MQSVQSQEENERIARIYRGSLGARLCALYHFTYLLAFHLLVSARN